MSYPVIRSISTSVSGNHIDFIVSIDITGATESATIGVQYYVPESDVYNDASYSHYTNDGNYYSYYFYPLLNKQFPYNIYEIIWELYFFLYLN